MKKKGRCKRRTKSMAGGRGTAELKKNDSGSRSPNLKSDIAEKPLGSPEITEIPSASIVPLDLYSQALKVLSFRSPYDSEDSPTAQASVSTANNLPTVVSNFLSWHSESRKRHKKLHTGTDKKSSASAKIRVNNIWKETEEYFRELTVGDVERLERLSNISLFCDLDCFLTPCLDEDKKFFDRQETISGMLANACSNDIKLEDCIEMGTVGVANHNEFISFQNGRSLTENAVETSEIEIRSEKNDDDPPNGQGLSNSFCGVEWLLGSRNKIYLSSERPSKKRKISSSDSGLEKLHMAHPVEGLQSLCHYCSYSDMGDPLNCLIKCSSCGMVTHKKCYGVQEDADRYWLCSWCKLENVSVVNAEVPCLLCPKQGGALKPVNLGELSGDNNASTMEFAHLFCCLWTPKAYVENTQSMEPIIISNEMKGTRKRLICSLCKNKNGTCIRCSSGSCRNSFHPICAREARQRLEIWGKHGSDEVQIRAFCSKHSEVHYEDNFPETGDSTLTSDCVSNGYGENSTETEANLESHQENGDAPHPFTVGCSLYRDDKKDVGPCSILKFSKILRTLIDLGKVNAETVASEIGVTPHSLTSLLTDKDTDPAIQCKVVRWLINNAHFGHFQKTLKEKISSLLAMKDNSGVAEGASSGSVEDSNNSQAVPGKSFSPRKRNKHISRHVKDDSTGPSEDSNNFSEKVLIDPAHDDISAKESSKTEVNLKALAECLSENCVFEDAKLMRLMAAPSVLKIGDMNCASYMHLITYGKLMEAKSDMLQETGCCHSSVLRDRETSQASSISGLCCNNSTLPATSADRSSGYDGLSLDQLKSLRNNGIFGLAPADEVEGELMYYQQRLIYMNVLRKHLSDDLISKVVRSLPEEISSAGERKWDAVLVNQYNHSQRESKKQGRKERRHKEAQQVLAAATAAAAASSRLSSNRKDNLEESSLQEDILKTRQSNARQSVTRSSENSEADLFVSSTNNKFTLTCDVCNRTPTMLNPVLLCSGCKVSVHLDCYRSDKNTVGPWYCELCEELISSQSPGALASNSLVKPNFVPECALCGGTAGALRKSGDGRWIHALCAEWILDSTYRRGQVNPIILNDSVGKGAEFCTVCCRKQGVCLKCCFGHCHTAFHPTCARSADFYMTVKTSGSKLQHKAYCAKHSLEQRAKADIQKHGIEELKSLKQIRVELERLRLLCERIVRREKLKRELVICSHDVLASSRDSLLSVLARHPFYQPEVSSESATTSLKGHMDDYMSCSGMIQRADDITVDCTVAGKRRVRLPVCFDNDRKTDDSSTSQNLLKISFPSNTSRNLSEDDEKQSKSFRKQNEASEMS